MDNYAAEALVNGDEPIPVIASLGNKHLGSSDERKRDRLKQSLSGSNLRNKFEDAVAASKGAVAGIDAGQSLQDRLLTKLLQQVVPHENVDEVFDSHDERATKNINRPGFSLPLMTNNFRRFNSRVGVVFVFQNRLIRLFTWREPSQTLSLLAVYTFVCLNPYLLAVVPLAFIVLFVMVPAFLARHPPSPSTAGSTSGIASGPPIAPPRAIRPATEMSKDFFRNMRDIQNVMDDFTSVHDIVLAFTTSPMNFSNEALSSTLFLFLFLLASILFIIAHLLPWRFMALAAGWTAIALGHPKVQVVAFQGREDYLRHYEKRAQTWLDGWVDSDIILDSPLETREVEIFELQRRRGDEWESCMFSPSPYDSLSPARIAGNRPKGSRFFEDVVPPSGWEWGAKKWALDFAAQEWVEERMVQNVEIEMEGERWVSDLVDGNASVAKTDTLWRRRRWVRTVRRKVAILGEKD